MSIGQQFGMPGVDAIQSTLAYDITWGGTRNQIKMLQAHGVHYSSDIVDTGATPTTTIRAGLLLAKLTSSGELKAWVATAADGTQDLFGVNPTEFYTLDNFGTATDRNAPSAIVQAPLRARSLLIQGTVLTSHADEFLARRQLQLMGCTLDDDPQGVLTGLVDRTVYESTAALTPTTAQNGTTFLCDFEGAMAVTLPTCQVGLTYTFIRYTSTAEVAFTEGAWSVTTAGGADVMMGESADAAVGDVDTITYTTADEHIGSWVRVRGIYDMGLTTPIAKWFVEKNEGRTYAFSVT
jgi:hypothetical protein